MLHVIENTQDKRSSFKHLITVFTVKPPSKWLRSKKISNFPTVSIFKWWLIIPRLVTGLFLVWTNNKTMGLFLMSVGCRVKANFFLIISQRTVLTVKYEIQVLLYWIYLDNAALFRKLIADMASIKALSCDYRLFSLVITVLIWLLKSETSFPKVLLGNCWNYYYYNK